MIPELDRVDAVYNAIEARDKRPDVYVSPFEAFKQRFPHIKWQDMSEIAAYRGTVASVINNLEDALVGPDQDRDFFSIALHPPRLIRAVIDWKIENPFDEVEDLVSQVVQTGLAIYAGDPNAPELLQAFRGRIELEQPQLLTTIVEQKDDLPTWVGTDPEKSYETAKRLAYGYDGDNILLIALGHGGTAAGMDVFLRYQDITQSDSAFYVVRFSRHKKEDEKPQLTISEIAQLREMTQARRIIVFEEDSVSGKTMEGACSYFKLQLFNGLSIDRAINYRAGYTSTVIDENKKPKEFTFAELSIPEVVSFDKPILYTQTYNNSKIIA